MLKRMQFQRTNSKLSFLFSTHFPYFMIQARIYITDLENAVQVAEMAPIRHIDIAHEDDFGVVKNPPLEQNKPCMRDAVQDIWGERMGFHGENQWPVRVDQHTTEQPEKWNQSACVMCSNGCGMDIGVKHGKIVGVRGRAQDRVNKGR